MNYLTALTAALLLNATQPLLMNAATALSATMPSGSATKAQGHETADRIAQAITVRIEGAVRGSGVIVKKEGSRYTVLTSWHVIGQQSPGEEIDIYTSEGLTYRAEERSIERIGAVDLGLITFVSNNLHRVAQIREKPDTSIRGDAITVYGYPSDSDNRLASYSGNIVASATAQINEGYQILYTNKTIAGMSGGPIVDGNGLLIGIHGRGELNRLKHSLSGFPSKTGINQGIPISYYQKFESGTVSSDIKTRISTTDDHLLQAKLLSASKRDYLEIIRLTSIVLGAREDALAYFLRGDAKKLGLRNEYNAIPDYTKAIQINPLYAEAYLARASAFMMIQDYQKAIKDYTYLIERLSSSIEYLAFARSARGAAFNASNQLSNALSDYNWILSNGQDGMIPVSPDVLRITVRGLVSTIYKAGNRRDTCFLAKSMHEQGFTVRDLLPQNYCSW